MMHFLVLHPIPGDSGRRGSPSLTKGDAILTPWAAPPKIS